MQLKAGRQGWVGLQVSSRRPKRQTDLPATLTQAGRVPRVVLPQQSVAVVQASPSSEHRGPRASHWPFTQVAGAQQSAVEVQVSRGPAQAPAAPVQAAWQCPVGSHVMPGQQLAFAPPHAAPSIAAQAHWPAWQAMPSQQACVSLQPASSGAQATTPASTGAATGAGQAIVRRVRANAISGILRI